MHRSPGPLPSNLTIGLDQDMIAKRNPTNVVVSAITDSSFVLLSFDQSQARYAVDLVANRPGTCGGNGQAVGDVVGGAWVGAELGRPPLAVPVLDHRLGRGIVDLVVDRPGVGTRTRIPSPRRRRSRAHRRPSSAAEQSAECETAPSTIVSSRAFCESDRDGAKDGSRPGAP